MDEFAPPADSGPSRSLDRHGGDLDSPARTAAILGILALTMNMLACCFSIFAIMAGTVLGTVAAIMGRSVLDQDPEGEALAYANVGFWSGLIAALWGVFVAFLVFCYVMLYVGVIVLAIVAGA